MSKTFISQISNHTGLFLVALTGISIPTIAAQGAESGQYIRCSNRATNGVQQSVCDQAELGVQDGRLNKAYKQLMTQLTRRPAAQIQLRNQQRAWIKRRDYECKVDDSTVDIGCLVKMTAEKADELEGRIVFNNRVGSYLVFAIDNDHGVVVST